MEAEKQRKEADKLFEQGAQQYKISQFREALQSWEKFEGKDAKYIQRIRKEAGL